jgi:two-component system chemotaxis sensor kinase CheA
MDINRKLLAAFQVEHVEHLEGIRTCLARWQELGAAPDVDEAFRRAHSLKGAARVTGLAPVEALAHQLENLFSLLRAHTLPADAQALQVATAALDAIEDSASCLLQGDSPPDASTAVARLDALVRSLQEPASVTPPLHPAASNRAEPGETFRVSAGGPAGDSPQVSPAISPQSVHAPASESLGHGPAIQPVETVRLRIDSLDRLLQSTSQLLTENLQQDSLSRELQAIHQQLTVIEREWEALQRTAEGPLRRLNAVPQLAGLAKYVELVEHEMSALSRRFRAARLLQLRSSWSVRLLAEQLQEDVRQARMVPAESEFHGFRKMMRDLVRDQGKEIEFRVTGFEVLADRMVLQALKDPLMHVLRNAVTHGIEPPDERKSVGKSPAGLVTLAIRAVGNRLTLEVEDDGRGVDLAHVSELAVRRGLLSRDEAAARSAAELSRLLFLPGFSTSRAVTELSGRGMGLSAVHEAVFRLQGEVVLRPREDVGTSLVIAVPLSISTHRLLLVTCRGQVLAVPFDSIEALHHVKVQDVETVEGVPMVALGGRLTPLTSMAHLLDETQENVCVEADTLSIVALRCGPKRVAVAVDSFRDERSALITNLGPPADDVATCVGGILLEDGSVSPVLNPAELIERFKITKKASVFVADKSSDTRLQPNILVVDDSFTTRTLETSILETNGYQVQVAVDGVEALEKLRTNKIDLVISDIQMPRLDGFGLLEAIKRDPGLSSIPVIIVSSVDGSEDQQRGLRLGADAYIVKRKFDHQELLKVVQQIL